MANSNGKILLKTPERYALTNETSITYHLAELELAKKWIGNSAHLPQVPSSCQVLLDVGCGIGQSLVVLGQDQRMSLFGVDIDADAVAFGSKTFTNLNLSVARGEHLPFAANFADMVICRVALPYMDIPTALQEFHRVLRPGGTLWISYHPVSMFVTDFREAVVTLRLRSIVYRTYALLNGILLLSKRQLSFPLNRKRVESYQNAFLLTRALRNAGFTDTVSFGNTLSARSSSS